MGGGWEEGEMSGSSRCDGEGGRGYLRHVSRVSYDSTWWPASGLEKKGSTGTNRDERGLESVESVLEAWDLCQHRYVPVLQPDLGAVLILVCLIVRLGDRDPFRGHIIPFLSTPRIVPSQHNKISISQYLFGYDIRTR